MSSFPLGLVSKSDSSTRVYGSGLLDDKSIALKTSDVTTRIGQRDLIDLIRVKPDFVLAALEYGCSKAFLKLEGNCRELKKNTGNQHVRNSKNR